MNTKVNVLIVEADELDRETIHRLLGQEYSLQDAATKREVLELIETSKPDVVLLSYSSQDVDAIEVLKQLVAAKIPTIALTGVEYPESIVGAMRAGAQDYLVKRQLTSTALAHAIHEALKKMRMIRELFEQQELLVKQAQLLAMANESANARIIRSIEFSPEYHQAGISILSYFGTVLRNKYADLNAKVRIEQQDLKVTLVIISPDGEQEIIERALNEYGSVVMGQMTPEEFYSDNLKALELRQQLRMSHLQLENQREIQQLIERHYDNRIASLEAEVTWLRYHVGTILHFADATPKLFKVNHICTDGGPYIQGNVDTHDGNFIGRDRRTES